MGASGVEAFEDDEVYMQIGHRFGRGADGRQCLLVGGCPVDGDVDVGDLAEPTRVDQGAPLQDAPRSKLASDQIDDAPRILLRSREPICQGGSSRCSTPLVGAHGRFDIYIH